MDQGKIGLHLQLAGIIGRKWRVIDVLSVILKIITKTAQMPRCFQEHIPIMIARPETPTMSMQGNTVAKLDRAETVGQVSAPNRILRNDIKANKIEIFGDAEVNKPCAVYRKDAKDVNDEYSLNILFQESNVEKMRQNVPENIEEKVVPSQVLKQYIIINRVKAATMKVSLVISEQNTKAVIDTGAEVTVLS